MTEHVFFCTFSSGGTVAVATLFLLVSVKARPAKKRISFCAGN